MFWNPEVITTTGKSLRITQIQFNIIYIMRTNINQGRIQSLAVMIVLLINNDQNPISYLIPYSRLNRSCNLNTLVSTTSYPLYGINAAISAIADKSSLQCKAGTHAVYHCHAGVVVSRTVIGTDAVIKPVIQRPAVNISAGLIRIVLIPGRVQSCAVTADAPIRFITHMITLSITVLIGIACHDAEMPAILRVATPLRQIAA